MQVGGITEIIAHFIGLLHVDANPERVWDHVDGSADMRYLNYNGGHAPASSFAAHDISTDPTAGVGGIRQANAGSQLLQYAHLKYHEPPHHPAHIHAPTYHLHHQPFPEDGGGSSGGGGESSQMQIQYGVVYTPPDEIVADIHQANLLIANNIMIDHPGSWAAASPATGLYLQKMIDIGEAPGTHTGLPFGVPANQLIQTIAAHAPEIFGPHHGMSPMVQGTTVDGVTTSTDGTPQGVTLPDATTNALTQAAAVIDSTSDGTVVPLGAQIVTGGNVAANAALIVDTSAVHLGQVVLGNSYHADLVVQTNVVSTSDSIALTSADQHPSASLAASVVNSPDTVSNTAHFSSGPLDISGVMSTSLATGWSLNVVHGDFYDIQTITQQNVLINDNIYVGTPQMDHYEAILGGNVQGNLFQLVHDGPSYDLLIVEGNSYTGSFISQTNVFLGDNATGVTLASNSADAHVAAGGNSVTNEASIYDASNNTAQPLSGNLAAFAQELISSGGTSAPAGADLNLPGLGGPLNILLVTGDYYDLNVISQINVVSNNGVVNANLSALSAGTPAVIETGGNTLANSATIVTAAGQSGNFVGGQAYDSALLVQANLISSQANTQVVPANALIPQLSAFLSSEADHPADSFAPLTVSTTTNLNAPHQDILLAGSH